VKRHHIQRHHPLQDRKIRHRHRTRLPKRLSHRRTNRRCSNYRPYFEQYYRKWYVYSIISLTSHTSQLNPLSHSNLSPSNITALPRPSIFSTAFSPNSHIPFFRLLNPHPLPKLNSTKVASSGTNIYLLCASGACSDWSFGSVSITGGKASTKCSNIPSGSGASC
jgi:hypothetical protein